MTQTAQSQGYKARRADAVRWASKGKGMLFEWDADAAVDAAVQGHAAVMVAGPLYYVPAGNEYSAEGEPVEGGLDWCLEHGWELLE